jgi:hypothetical protein
MNLEDQENLIRGFGCSAKSNADPGATCRDCCTTNAAHELERCFSPSNKKYSPLSRLATIAVLVPREFFMYNPAGAASRMPFAQYFVFYYINQMWLSLSLARFFFFASASEVFFCEVDFQYRTKRMDGEMVEKEEANAEENGRLLG